MNRRLGLVLFLIYSSFYALFMVLAAFYPNVVALRPTGGLNVAVGYGFGLIFGAFALSLVYLLLARDETPKTTKRIDAERTGADS